MKRAIIIYAILFLTSIGIAKTQSISPFYKIDYGEKSEAAAVQNIKLLLAKNNFQVLGSYHPEKNKQLLVIAFTDETLKKLCLQFPDRGALAGVLKVGLYKKNGKTIITFNNPEYIFLAYWGKQLTNQKEKLEKYSNRIKNLFSSIGKIEPFGGSLSKKELPGYHYKIFMPYFTDPDKLATFSSFKTGLDIIRQNLKQEKGDTQGVYELIFPDKQIAVFGVGLLNPKTGEPHFLPIIGESHLAALPYQIILQGKEATSLPGKYRLALFWPELSMGTFMKIMTTPGEIRETLKMLTEK